MTQTSKVTFMSHPSVSDDQYKYFTLLTPDTGIAELGIRPADCSDDLSQQNLLEEFDKVLCELEQWQKGKCVIVTGLHVFGLRWSAEVAKQLEELLKRLQALPLLSVALLDGWVSGAGSQLSIACDFRAFTERSHIALVEWGSAMDMIKQDKPDLINGGSRLRQLLREPKNIEIAVSGHPIAVSEAKRIGLCQYVLTGDREAAAADCRQWLDQYTRYDTDCIRAMKRIVHYACTLPLEEALQKERELFVTVWGKPAHRAALAANIKHK